MSEPREWAWPTECGWIFVILLLLEGMMFGGWRGLAIVTCFVSFISIIGNVALPKHRDEEAQHE